MGGKILIPQEISQAGIKFLKDRGYVLVKGHGTDHEMLMRDIADCDAVLLRTAVVDREVLMAAKKLKVVARHGAGYDNVDYEAAEQMKIQVTYSPFTTGVSVAEFTMAVILSAARNLEQNEKELRNGNFNWKFNHHGIELEGKTLGIIGLGNIGKLVAKRAYYGFDMKIISYIPRTEGKVIPEYVTPVSWDELFEESDFVSVHVPGGAKNKGIIGKMEFDLMKKTAILINASRGGIVSEGALIEALRNGQIAGAAVDVFEKEPPDTGNPLLSMANVLPTPHIASNTEECMEKIALDAAAEIDRVLSGKKPLHPVNHPLM